MMKPAPRASGRAKVLYYSPIDHRHRPTGGCKQIVAGVLQGPAAGLAICQDEQERGYYLFGCDTGWKEQTVTWRPTLEEAMEQAEFEYEGDSQTW
jgi:hypothetical protein